MENCPKCKEKLNIDEKSAGRCFSCGATFSSNIPKDNKNAASFTVSGSSDNITATILSILGIVIIVLGTIVNAATKYDDSSWFGFFEAEVLYIFVGMVAIGLAEIIRLLEAIKNKK